MHMLHSARYLVLWLLAGLLLSCGGKGEADAPSGASTAISMSGSHATVTLPSPLAAPTILSPLVTPGVAVNLLPTPTPLEAVIEELAVSPLPTVTPTPLPPYPTPIPTDVVTPIPHSEPPFIPDIAAKEPQPFWIYYWYDNEVWRVDSQGNDQEKLLDTYAELGQWLTGHPIPNSDCCWVGPRVVVSPDGSKLALVVLDKINIMRGESFTYSIYVFDVASRSFQYVGTGYEVEWSPDSTRIALISQGVLYVSDLINEPRRLVTPPEDSLLVGEYEWSNDGQRIAYMLDEARIPLSTIWLVDVKAENSPVRLVELAPDPPPYLLTWAEDDSQLFFVSAAGTRDLYQQNRFNNISAVSLQTRQVELLTHNVVVYHYRPSPDGQWFVLYGYLPYEQAEDRYESDLWLVHVNDFQLKRITTGLSNMGFSNYVGIGWSPDATRLLLSEYDGKTVLFSLQDGSVTDMGFPPTVDSAVGGLK